MDILQVAGHLLMKSKVPILATLTKISIKKKPIHIPKHLSGPLVFVGWALGQLIVLNFTLIFKIMSS